MVISKTRKIFIVILTLCLGALIWVKPLFALPETKADMEGHLQREIDTYAVINDTPLLVASFGNANVVFLDTIRLDPISMEFPPTPRWQRTGNWITLDLDDQPATGMLAQYDDQRVVFGVINDDRIATIDLVVDEAVISTTMREDDGFIIPAANASGSDSVVFRDANGEVIYTMNLEPYRQISVP